MFERILVPLDGSPLAERALPVAALIARSTGATVVLLHAASIELEYGPYFAQATAFVETALETEIDSANAYLELIASSETLAGIKTEKAVVPGMAAQTILTYAQYQHVDLIVMCSQGYTGVKRWMLGSVAVKVARHAPVPVLVLQDHEPIPAHPHPGAISALRAIVALDGSALSEATLEPVSHLVAALSAPAKGSIHLLRVVQVPVASSMQKKQVYGEEIPAQALYDAQAYLASLIERLQKGIAADLNLKFTSSVITNMDVAQAIIQEGERAEKTGEDEQLIAMCTHGRSGLQLWATGSVTENVLHGTHLPLFIVHPTSGRLH